MLDLLKSLNIHQYDCDLIDIRIEETNPLQISFYQKELSNYMEEKKLGAFIRVYANKRWYFTTTTELSELEKELHNLLKSANISTNRNEKKDIEYNITNINNLNGDYAYKKSKEEKIVFLNKIRESFENDPLLINPWVGWKDNVLQKYFINNKGTAYSYNKAFSAIAVRYELKQDENIYNAYFNRTVQYFKDFSNFIEEFQKDFAESKLFIDAPTIEPGKYITVLGPQATGIFAHESFGHKSESDFMLGDETMVKEWEIGKKVANECVSIIDCGINDKVSGYCPFDDEGNPAQTTYLIKNGILTGRLHNETTAKALNEDNTSNARAISFEWEPTVRMRNTYFEKGDLTFDELIKPIEKGYFIKTVNHGSGMSTFTIAANKSYKIENGKITDPVKINIATGTVFQTLHDIDAISDKIELFSQVFGGCGKNYQWPLDVSFGGPYIRVKSLNLS
ncbi:MAG: TldD/PmbA family protein [Candidatus Cloacimonetes bacterium]|nr:TldD/PmbA family protein [Candidatus Cloacimonadota bacterium]